MNRDFVFLSKKGLVNIFVSNIKQIHLWIFNINKYVFKHLISFEFIYLLFIMIILCWNYVDAFRENSWHTRPSATVCFSLIRQIYKAKSSKCFLKSSSTTELHKKMCIKMFYSVNLLCITMHWEKHCSL